MHRRLHGALQDPSAHLPFVVRARLCSTSCVRSSSPPRRAARASPGIERGCLHRRLRPPPAGRSDSERAVVALALRSLAQPRAPAASRVAGEAELARRVQALALELLARRGVGPIWAAAVLVTWSAPGAGARRRPSPVLPGRHRSVELGGRSCATGSTAARPTLESRASHDRPLSGPRRRGDQGLHRPPSR